MAIFKARYTRNPTRIKKSIRYIAHRPGKEGEKISRTLFGFDGVMEKEHGYRMIDEAGEGMYFYRMVLSPDPRKEDTFKDLDMWEMTKKFMEQLEDKLDFQIQFIASEHNDHAPHRHIHAIVALPQRLTKKDCNVLRNVATSLAVSQRKELDRHPIQQQEQSLTYTQEFAAIPNFSAGETYQAKPMRREVSCPVCGAGHSMWHVGDGVYRCPECGLVLGQGLRLEIATPKLQPTLKL